MGRVEFWPGLQPLRPITSGRVLVGSVIYFERDDTAFARFAEGNTLFPLVLIVLMLVGAWEMVGIASR